MNKARRGSCIERMFQQAWNSCPNKPAIPACLKRRMAVIANNPTSVDHAACDQAACIAEL
jgi:hypothetical protein